MCHWKPQQQKFEGKQKLTSKQTNEAEIKNPQNKQT